MSQQFPPGFGAGLLGQQQQSMQSLPQGQLDGQLGGPSMQSDQVRLWSQMQAQQQQAQQQQQQQQQHLQMRQQQQPGQPSIFNSPNNQALNSLRSHNFARMQNQTHLNQQKQPMAGFNLAQHLPAGAGFNNSPQPTLQNGMHQPFSNMGGMGGVGGVGGGGGLGNNAAGGLSAAMQMQLRNNPQMLSQMIQNQGLQTQNQGRQLEMLLQQQGQQGAQGNQLAMNALRQRSLQQQIQQMQQVPNQQAQLQQQQQHQQGINHLGQLGGQVHNVNGGFFGGNMPGNMGGNLNGGMGGNMGGNMSGMPGGPRAPSAQPNMHQQNGLITPSLLGVQDGQDGQHRMGGATPFMELRTRIASLNDTLQKLKARDTMLTQRLATDVQNPALMKEKHDTIQEMHQRRAVLGKLLQELQINHGQAHPGQGNAADNHIPSMPPVSPLMVNKDGQMQTNWMGQQVPQGHGMMSMQQQHQQPQPQPQQPQSMAQAGPSQPHGMPHMPQQMQNNQPAQFPPGSAQMSFQQLPGARAPNQASPNFPAGQIANQYPPANGAQQVMQQQQQHQQLKQPYTKPLPLEQFRIVYPNFCKQQHISPDQNLMIHDGRQIDLYSLHREVISSGSLETVTKHDLWPVIGAKLGFVQFPASDSEPARCGPGVAERIKTVYERYMYAFDTTYQRSMAAKPQVQRPPQQPSIQQNALLAQRQQMGGTPVIANTEAMQQPPQQQPPAAIFKQLGLTDQNQIRELILISMTAPQELQRRGVPPDKIRLLEAHRPTLMQYLKRLDNSSRGVANGTQQNGTASQQNAAQTQFQNQQAGAVNGGMGMQKPLQQPQPPQMRPGQAGVPQQPGASQQGAPARPGNQGITVTLKPRTGPPTMAEREHAQAAVEQWKNEGRERISKAQPKPLPDQVRMEYHAAFTSMARICAQLEPNFPIFACLLTEDFMKRLCAVSVMARIQSEMLTKEPATYIIEPHQIKMFNALLVSAYSAVQKHPQAPNAGAQGANAAAADAASLRPPSVAASVPRPPSSQTQSSRPPGGVHHPHPECPPTPQPPNQPPAQHSQVSLPPQQSPSHVSPSAHPAPFPAHHPTPPANTQSPSVAPRMVKRPPPTPTMAHIDLTATSTPPPTASTPVASAATPVHIASSPQTPKSPKTGRAPKQAKASASKRKPAPVTAKSAPTPNAEGQPPTPAASTSAEVGQKRPREEDALVLSVTAPMPEPSPKRIKTEWDGPKEEALLKKEQQSANIKTEEDATRFFEEMSTLLKRTLDESPSGLSSEISDSLGQILKGYSQPPDLDLSGFGSLGGGDGFDFGTSPPPLSGQLAMDELQFFDFSSFEGQEDETKAETPDLVQASSTKTSPGSASEMDGLGHSSTADMVLIADMAKEEEMDEPDPLRLGFWREIDGGEAPYFQSDGWKWDGPMPTSEQPWAISTA